MEQFTAHYIEMVTEIGVFTASLIAALLAVGAGLLLPRLARMGINFIYDVIYDQDGERRF